MNTRERLQPFLDLLDTESGVVFAKRLSANDTGASDAHQAGIYLPNDVAFHLCPRLIHGGTNPDSHFQAAIVSHGVERHNRLTWYNQKSRNECRITRWADEYRRNSVLISSMTGALVVILFKVVANEIVYSWVWFCATPDEEDVLEERLGIVEPGKVLFDGTYSARGTYRGGSDNNICARLIESIPRAWHTTFPDSQEIVRLTYGLLASSGESADLRLLARRECEYRIFQTVEESHVLPKIRAGFDSVDAFVELANSVTNRRKSRSGKSFEHQLEQIFTEDHLSNTRGGKTEGKKTPDFLFPSVTRYHDAAWPREKIRMLGVKTTCKDRWRQILNEAGQIQNKHLITLQEGVSVEQFREMESSGVTLVVPKNLHRAYPKEIREHLVSLSTFIMETKELCTE